MSTHATSLATPLAVKTPPEASFGFGEFLHVVEKRKALIRNVALAVVAITAAAMFALPTLYSTSAVVMLDQRKNTVADASTVLSALPTDPSSVQNQIHVLSSRDLALKVIDKLHLDNDPEFNPALANEVDINPLHYLRKRPNGGDPASLREAIVSNFLSRLDVSSLGVSTSIEVAFTSKDPQKAARIANTLAKSYTEDMIATKVDASRKAAAWLSERMHQLADQVQQQEAAIELYKAEHDLVEAESGTSLVDQQLLAINTQLVNAQSDLAEKKAAYDRVNVLSKTGNTADVTPVVTSKMIGDLRAQEAELVRQEAELASRYGPNHPRMVAIRNEKRDLAAKIGREVNGIAGSMQSELEVAKAHVASIGASLARVSREARQENLARIKLNALQANLGSTRTMYETFVQRLRAVQDQDDMQLPEARVISTAPVPAAPSSPHRALFVGASIPAGLLLGILLALLLERFGSSAPMPFIAQRPRVEASMRFTPAMAEKAVWGAPVPLPPPPILAELAASADPRLADWVLDNPASPYALSLNQLLQGLTASGRGAPQIVTVTAPNAEASKSVAALALARTAALRGLRTVLLDADMGRLAPSGPQAGVAGFLQGVPLANLMLRDRRTHAFFMSASPVLWANPRTLDLVNHLKNNCDFIVIDAGPPMPGSAWQVLARLSDSVVLYTAAQTSQLAVDGALRSLVAMAAPVKGLVLGR